MIRPGRTPNPSHACHSADVLTPTERAASRRDHVRDVTKLIPEPRCLTWAQVPHIAKVLQSLRSKP